MGDLAVDAESVAVAALRDRRFDGRLAAPHGVRGVHPAAGKSLAGEVVEVGQEPGVDSLPAARVRRPRALDGRPVLPDRLNVAGRAHIGGRVAPDQEQVGLEARRDPAPVVQIERVRRGGGGGVQGCGRGQAGPDKEFEFTVNARSVSRARVRCVGARQNRHAGLVEGAGVPDRVFQVLGKFEAEVAVQVASLIGHEEGGDQWIGRQFTAAATARNGLDDGQSRNDESPGVEGGLDGVIRPRGVVEDVDQPVGAGADRLFGAPCRADVEDGQQIVAVGGGHDSRQGRGGVRGDGASDRCPGLVDHLDEVRPLGGAIGDELLRLRRIVQGRQRDPELRAVPAVDGDAAAGYDIGSVGGGALSLLPAPLSRDVGVGEHVEDGRDAEVERLLGRRSEVVRVAVDQPRQQGHALSLDDLGLGAGGCRNVGARRDRLDRAAADHDSGAIEHLVSGEYAGALDHGRRGLGVEGGAERREDGE